jgi:hypothetical protein
MPKASVKLKFKTCILAMPILPKPLNLLVVIPPGVEPV